MIFACSQDFYCMQLYPNFLTTFKAIPKTVLYLFWAAFLYSSVYCPCYPSEIIRSCAEKFLSYFVFASYLFIDCPWYSYSSSTYHKQKETYSMKMFHYNISCCLWYIEKEPEWSHRKSWQWVFHIILTFFTFLWIHNDVFHNEILCLETNIITSLIDTTCH